MTSQEVMSRLEGCRHFDSRARHFPEHTAINGVLPHLFSNSKTKRTRKDQCRTAGNLFFVLVGSFGFVFLLAGSGKALHVPAR